MFAIPGHTNKLKMRYRLAAIAAAMFVSALFYSFGQDRVASQSAGSKRYKPELVVQTGHTGDISSIAYSPDGKLVASGSFDNTIKLWDVETGKELRTFYGHTGKVMSVAFSPDGKLLASGGSDFVIRLWDVSTGKQAKVLEYHSNSVNAVRFSPDGKTIVSGSDDQTVKIWDVATGRNCGRLASPRVLISARMERQRFPLRLSRRSRLVQTAVSLHRPAAILQSHSGISKTGRRSELLGHQRRQ